MERLEKYGSGAVIRERLAAARGIFPTLNVDMIFNLPGQTLAMLDRDIGILLGLGVDQVSFYPLMTAPTARHKMEKTMGRADERLRHPMYERILDRLLPAYRASSAWCFSRGEGMFDEYIIDQDDYVGVGSGAFSYVGGTMYSTTFSLNHYCRRIEGGQSGITQHHPLGAKERMRYDFLVRLFGGELRRDDVAARYGRAFWLRMAPELAAMRLVGATRHEPDAIRLTRLGMYCWVLMMAEFFNAVNDVREQMREHIRAELDTWNEEARVPVAAIGRPSREVRT
jgi:coproporphyrinogen III oxidase-like Fe-S oxidoreductase